MDRTEMFFLCPSVLTASGFVHFLEEFLGQWQAGECDLLTLGPLKKCDQNRDLPCVQLWNREYDRIPIRSPGDLAEDLKQWKAAGRGRIVTVVQGNLRGDDPPAPQLDALLSIAGVTLVELRMDGQMEEVPPKQKKPVATSYSELKYKEF